MNLRIISREDIHRVVSMAQAIDRQAREHPMDEETKEGMETFGGTCSACHQATGLGGRPEGRVQDVIGPASGAHALLGDVEAAAQGCPQVVGVEGRIPGQLVGLGLPKNPQGTRMCAPQVGVVAQVGPHRTAIRDRPCDGF